jgi:hypothetical protein
LDDRSDPEGPESGEAVGEIAAPTNLERELCRLPEISAARVVTDKTGMPSEIHILATATKTAKQVVRDVQSVALASFGIELDRRIVSVVQLGDNGHGPVSALERVSRPMLLAVNAEINGLRCMQRVHLSRDDIEVTGFAEGSIASTARHRLVAEATIDALRQFDSSAERLDVDSAQVVRVGAQDVAIVTIAFVTPPSEQLVSGSAIVRGREDAEAVVRAVLDATNRRLPSLS